ncbi:MAG: T9SS type A sorting domain-containing protein [Dysgonamonadaceae bacterium]|jgi:hypothetical protein|nr:T9SS type A sorting domain-containing protein [Dysgonamonadaceae bacterium]
MKAKTVIFTVLVQSLAISVFSQNIINKVELTPRFPVESDSIFLIVTSDSFSGGCTYTSDVDSIVENAIHISGKYEGDAKCLGKIDNDKINLGKFKKGNYSVIYRLIDTSEFFPVEVHTLNLEIMETTGMKNIQQEIITVFPNPCSFQIKIAFAPPMFKCDQLQILNSFGQVLLEKRNFNSGEIVDTGVFANGIYFLRIADNNKLQTVKLIKR